MSVSVSLAVCGTLLDIYREIQDNSGLLILLPVWLERRALLTSDFVSVEISEHQYDSTVKEFLPTVNRPVKEVKRQK